MAIRKRQKASDIFNKSDLVYCEKTTFEKAFPEIEELSIQIEDYGHGVNQWNKFRSFSKSNSSGEYIDCINPLCYNGGFSIGDILREMIKNKEEIKDGSCICQGNEGSPKGRRVYRKCLNMFIYKVKIKFK
jgi:hypothetical protein